MTFLLSPTDEHIAFLRSKLPQTDTWEHALQDVPTSDAAVFLKHLGNAGSTRSLRRAPSTFIHRGTDPLRAVPLPERMCWDTLRETLTLIQARGGVLNMAPLLWHTEFLAHDATRAHGVPLSVTQPENMPLGISIMQQVEMEVVIVGHAHYDALVRLLKEKPHTHTPTILMMVTPLSDIAVAAPVDRDIYSVTLKEIHLLPGCPLFFQTLSIAGSSLYHLSTNFLWERHPDDAVYITALTDAVPDVRRYKLPIRISPATADSTEPVWTIHAHT